MPNPIDSQLNTPAETPREENEPKVLPFPVVGVGASAGGLEAFIKLLDALPTDAGMAYVLIQHLDPLHKSQLTEILSRSTAMPVMEVLDGTRVVADRVYIIPPNTALQIADGSLHLTPRSVNPVPHHPIDEFFESLAIEQGRLAFGILLSGTGADGSEGTKAIKGRCGITFAQDEESAAYPDMPRSAIAMGTVDYVLPPAGVAAELIRISRHPYVVPPGTNGIDDVLSGDQGELNQLYAMLFRAKDVDFSHYRQTTLQRRVGRRMLVRHIEKLTHYLEYVRHHPEELNELYRDLLINVTSFFRDPEAFLALKEQLVALVKSNRITDSFRAWVPGCSTGEEVYSLAMCVSNIFETAGIHPDIQLFGTDISESSLRVARAGLYAQNSLRDVSPQQLNRYFRKVDGKYQIAESIRESCIFAWHDVTRDTPFSHLDLISCRNMLIYVDSVLQKELIPIFHYGLDPFGLLFLGSSETTGASKDLFLTLDARHKIFSRQPGPNRLAAVASTQRGVVEPLTRAQVKRAINQQDVHKKIDRLIQARYSPDCVVVNQALQIVEIRGHVGGYLEPPPGLVTNDLLRMAREGLRYPLREVIDRALQANAMVEKKGIRFASGDTQCNIDIQVTPLPAEPGTERFYLVVFTAASQPPDLLKLDSSEPGAHLHLESISRLDAELADAREHIRNMSEDYEVTLEEARAYTEELQSANEELQSSNEELGTIKEELQSANEELTTVNEEMDNRNRQLGELSDDLVNLLGAVGIPILRVDRNMLLCRFTPAAEKAFSVTPSDLLQPLRILKGRLNNAIDLELLVRDVMDRLLPETHEMQDTLGRWWSLSVRPYRTADDRLDGAVLTFMDVDLMRQSLLTSQEARKYADSIVETVREPLVILTNELRVDRANAAFYNKFHLTPAEAEGKLLYDLSKYGWNTPWLRRLLEQVLRDNITFSDFEVANTFPQIGDRLMLLNARQLQIDSQVRILLAFEDVTDHRRAEEAIARKLEHTGRELDRSRDELRALTGHLMTAHEEEQRRIAHELHDDLVQRLAYLEFQVEQLRIGPIASGNVEVAELLNNLQRQIADLSEVTRNISHGLHPAVIDDLGMVAALRKLTKDFGAGRKAAVRFISRVGQCPLPRQQFGSAVYRIAQEALHNAGKHAPAADVTVTLTCKQNELLLTIRDDGPGFDPHQVRGAGGLGIINMQERARLLGATLHIKSKPGKGAAISLRAFFPAALKAAAPGP